MADDNYKGWLKPDFIKEIKRLNAIIAVLQTESITEKNERGAGRKPKLTKELHAEIINLLECGCSYRQVSKHLKISIGLVGKAYNNEQQRKEVRT